jgi:hypothetical protein
VAKIDARLAAWIQTIQQTPITVKTCAINDWAVASIGAKKPAIVASVPPVQSKKKINHATVVNHNGIQGVEMGLRYRLLLLVALVIMPVKNSVQSK